MRTSLGHMQLNVAAANIPFYADLFAFMGWPVLHRGEGILGLTGAGEESVWFVSDDVKDIPYDHDGPGLNHIAFAAASVEDVDAAAAYLREQDVAHLFETPRHRPEFAMSEAETYYQVMFETPDRLLFEVVYTGPLST